MVVNGAKKPDFWKNLAVTMLSKGFVTSADDITSAAKRYKERSYNRNMKKAAGEYYRSKQEEGDEGANREILKELDEQ